jgi:hypothetical protein
LARRPADANAINANSAASRTRDAHDESHADGETGGSGDGFAGSRKGASKPGSQGSSKAGKSGKAVNRIPIMTPFRVSHDSEINRLCA